MTLINNKHTRIRKIIALFTAAVFLIFLSINFFFSHTHILENGQLISHSHIVVKDSCEENKTNSHSHTEEEYTYHFLISSIINSFKISSIILFFTISVYFLITYPKATISQQIVILDYNSRGPPFFLIHNIIEIKTFVNIY